MYSHIIHLVDNLEDCAKDYSSKTSGYIVQVKAMLPLLVPPMFNKNITDNYHAKLELAKRVTLENLFNVSSETKIVELRDDSDNLENIFEFDKCIVNAINNWKVCA